MSSPHPMHAFEKLSAAALEAPPWWANDNATLAQVQNELERWREQLEDETLFG